MVRIVSEKLGVLSVEELANTITHGLGLLLSLIGFVVLMALAVMSGDRWSMISCGIYATSLVVLYAASTFYHSSTEPGLKKKLQIVDHCCIYLLIAGSYTPFLSAIAGESLGGQMLAFVWAFAAVGIIAKLFIGNRFPAINVTAYLLFGWLGVLAIEPVFATLGPVAGALTIAGGAAYTIGVVFFPMKFIRHHHAIFHVFILLGSIIHYAAIVMFVVPPRN